MSVEISASSSTHSAEEIEQRVLGVAAALNEFDLPTLAAYMPIHATLVEQVIESHPSLFNRKVPRHAESDSRRWVVKDRRAILRQLSKTTLVDSQGRTESRARHNTPPSADDTSASHWRFDATGFVDVRDSEGSQEAD